MCDHLSLHVGWCPTYSNHHIKRPPQKTAPPFCWLEAVSRFTRRFVLFFMARCRTRVLACGLVGGARVGADFFDEDESEGGERYCEWPGCENPSMTPRHPWCAMHYQRQHRGKPMNTPKAVTITDPFEALTQAAISLADCDSEDDDAWRKAENRLRYAARAFSDRVGKETMNEEDALLLKRAKAWQEANLKRCRAMASAGGRARQESMTVEQRKALVLLAARTRWSKAKS